MSSLKAKNRLYETNDFSIVSKYSAVKKGYYDDNILVKLVEEYLGIKCLRSPLVSRGYAIRSKIVDKSCRGIDEYLIVLGAGYDTMAMNKVIEDEETNTIFIEIDLPEVVKKKVEFITNYKVFRDDDQDLKSQEGPIYSSKFKKYHIIANDLRDVEKLGENLSKLIRKLNSDCFRFEATILNEVCLCYLNDKDIMKILRTVANCLKENSSVKTIKYVGFEQVMMLNKPTLMSTLMVSHFNSLSHPLKYFPNPNDHRNLLLSVDFEDITITSMAQIFNNQLHSNIESSESFDEFEELDAYLSHYALVKTKMNLRNQQASKYCKHHDTHSYMSSKFEAKSGKDIRYLKSSALIRRYGHSSCVLRDDIPLVTGGFGAEAVKNEQNLPHKRLADCVISDQEKPDLDFRPYIMSIHDKCPVKSVRLDRMHGQVKSLKGDRDLVFFHGGRQNPKQLSSANCPFIAALDMQSTNLVIQNIFDRDMHSCTFAYRHKLSDLRGDSLYQAGGIQLTQKHELIRWNFSSDKLGFERLQLESYEMFKRHSFGMDINDQGGLFLFGGLKTDNSSVSRFVNGIEFAILFDIRSEEIVKFALGNDLNYGSDVYFISDHQLIKVGGVCGATGYQDKYIELIDLRNNSIVTIEDEFSRSEEKQNYFTMLTNATSCHFKSRKEIVTIGGGGNYFTFGTEFNDCHLVYNYTGQFQE